MHANTLYVLASRATDRAVFFTDCKESFKEAVLRPGERVAVWDYEPRRSLAFEEDLLRPETMAIILTELLADECISWNSSKQTKQSFCPAKIKIRASAFRASYY
jgi:hypothetical protein